MSAFSLGCDYQRLIVEQSASASKPLKKRKEVKMKNKKKRLEDLDFVTELSMSEQEKINGGAVDVLGPISFTAEPKPPLLLGFTSRGDDGRS